MICNLLTTKSQLKGCRLECPKLHFFSKNDFWKLYIVSYHEFFQINRTKSEFSRIFSRFELWSFSPLNTCKTKFLLFSCIKEENISNFKSRKNRWKFPFSHIFSTGPIYLAKGIIWNTVQLSKILFLKNNCNLGHSIVGGCKVWY